MDDTGEINSDPEAPTKISDGDYVSVDPMRRGTRTRLLPETRYAAALAQAREEGRIAGREEERATWLTIVERHRDFNVRDAADHGHIAYGRERWRVIEALDALVITRTATP